MKPRTSILLAASCAAGLGVVTLFHAASAEHQEQCPNTEVLGNPPIYFPYPPGLIPPDLCSEVKRVQREVEVIFKEAPAKAPGLELLVAYRRDSQSEVLRSFLAVVREVVAR